MELLLDPVEVRVLGCLIEKDLATPEYYPMTMNALVNACNQKSNRDPTVSWDEDLVSEGIDSLREKKLVGVLTGGGNRVPKYNHRIGETLNLGRRELALLCELMLRGPQTLGELRDRASRMSRFSDTDEVLLCLTRLHDFPGQPLVQEVPRQVGQKEVRFGHLLSGEPQLREEVVVPRSSGGLEGRISALESEVSEMRQQLAQLRRELGLI